MQSIGFDFLGFHLLAGSHEFPGEARGACINEVAAVAAGYGYREIKSADDCPPCFSRPIAAFLIALNDRLDDVRRQMLKPYAFRLARTADTPAVERERVAVVSRRTVSGDLLRWRLTDLPWPVCGTTDFARISVEDAFAIVEDMLAIGRQAPPIEPESAYSRLATAFGISRDSKVLVDA